MVVMPEGASAFCPTAVVCGAPQHISGSTKEKIARGCRGNGTPSNAAAAAAAVVGFVSISSR